MRSVGQSWIRPWALALGVLAIAAGTAEAQRGRIRGRVVDRETRQPLAQVQVTLAGTTVGALTDATGGYRIDGVPPGQIEVRARIIGYQVASRTVNVFADQETVADFALAAAAVGLDAIVVTASGQQQAARELPNSVSQVNLGDITPTAPIANMADALSARAPSLVIMQSSGTTGGGTRIRIRGANSVSLSNEPVIFVDGVRVQSGAASIGIGVGGQQPSRINDINPEDIESIEVIKGPSASALYGTAAANGIIRIRTRRGRPGATTWRAFAEVGTMPQFTDWPDNFFGRTATGGLCRTYAIGLGLCTQADILRLNPLRDDPPYRDGSRRQFGISASGGSERTTFYVASDFEREFGVWNTSSLERVNLRANLQTELAPTVNLSVSTGYLTSDLRLPDNDNNALGFLGSGLLGGRDTTRNGWGFLLPEETERIIAGQEVERFTGSVNADARPFPWLALRATLGIDFTQRHDSRTLPPNEVPFNVTTLEGSRSAVPTSLYAYTANFSATATRRLSRRVTSTTTVGMQYFRDRFFQVVGSGRQLAGGTRSLNGIGVPTVDEENDASITLGFFVEEQIALNDRLYITGAVRQDDNSAFGNDFGGATYPKIGASWVISEEPFFPRSSFLSWLRLRAAYGASGLQPGTIDALQFFEPVAVTAPGGATLPAFTVSNVGNPALKPERSTEVELGFDAGVASERVRVEFTYYDKNSRDALIARPLAPSLGSSTAQFFNLGEMSNRGTELTLSGRPLDRPNVSLDLGFSFWTNRNRVVDLGTDFNGNPLPDIVFGTQRHRRGFPAGAYFIRQIDSVVDRNNDGLIVASEVYLDTAFTFVGTPFPTRGYSLSSTLTLMRRLGITTTWEYRSGHHLDNLTASFRCRFQICREINDPSTPIQQQANAVSALFFNEPNGYIEPADFLKLREISITYSAPDRWARFFGASGMSLTLAGRNLATWTDYSGFDPEINGNGQAANFGTRDFLTQPPVKFYTARLNLTF